MNSNPTTMNLNRLLPLVVITAIASTAHSALLAPFIDPGDLLPNPPEPLTAEFEFILEGAYASDDTFFFDGPDPRFSQHPLDQLPLPIVGAGQLGYAFQADPQILFDQAYLWTLQVQLDVFIEVGFTDPNGGGPIVEDFGFFINESFDLGGPFTVGDATQFLIGLDPYDFIFAAQLFFQGLETPSTLGLLGAEIDAAIGPLPPLLPPLPIDLGLVDYVGFGRLPLGGIDFAMTEVVPGVEYANISAIGAVRVELQSVPEPSTYGLIGAGSLGVLVLARRLRSRKVALSDTV